MDIAFGPINTHERRCWHVERLLAMPRFMLSQSTVLQLSKLHHQSLVEHRASERLSAPEENSAGRVTLKYGTFAWHLQELGWVKLAHHSKNVETQSTSTQIFPEMLPDIEARSLPEIAKIFGFTSCTDTDPDGKNICLHMFTSLTYCHSTAIILKEAFEATAPRLPGSYSSAMSQRVTSGTPIGHSPLHVLCDGSSINFSKIEIVQMLIENDIVKSELFATVKDKRVTV